MEVVATVTLILLSLSILVTIHELGHFWAARLFNIRVEVFSIFFPPKLFGFKVGETSYQVGSIPLGGYVKISGMIDESMDTEQMKQPVQDWEFRSKPVWQRFIVMIGGIVMNVLLGIILFAGLKYVYGDQKILISEVSEKGMFVPESIIGHRLGFRTNDKLVSVNGTLPKYFDDAASLSIVVEEGVYFEVERDNQKIKIAVPDTFMDVVSQSKKSERALFLPCISTKVNVKKGENYPAELAGVLDGDKIVKLEGKPIYCFSEIAQTIGDYSEKKMSIAIERPGVDTLLPFEFTLGKKPLLGVSSTAQIETDTITYGFFESFVVGGKHAFTVVFDQMKAQKKIATGKASFSKSITGPIGMAVMLYEQFKIGGWKMFWGFTAFISMVLAYMNILPIPGLDGGHMVFLLYEGITGREPSEKVRIVAQYIGLIIILGLMVLVFGLDIINLLKG